jgi:hypothetical protein
MDKLPPTAETPADTLDALQRERVQRELEHRFRHTLRTGQVSPLLHLMLRHQLEEPRCPTSR